MRRGAGHPVKAGIRTSTPRRFQVVTSTTEVVTPMSPEYPGNTHKRILTETLSVYENGPSYTELVEAIEAGASTLVVTAGIEDFTTPEAQWLLDGLRQADGTVVTAMENTEGLVASVLADLRRKGWPWERQRFRAFMKAAVEIRNVGDCSKDDAVEYVSVAWPDRLAFEVRAGGRAVCQDAQIG